MDNEDLQRQIEELKNKMDAIYSGNLPNELIQKLQTEGFIKEIGPKIITYTNPSGKDFYSTFINFKDETYSIAVQEFGTYYPVDSVDVGADKLNMNGHPFSDGAQVQVATSSTPPGGLAPQVIYYIVSSTANSVKVSLSFGGTAVNITSIGSGLHYLTAL